MSNPATKYPELFAGLARRFTREEEKSLKKGTTTLTYVTARTVANRLDEVLGPENWWDGYTPLMADSVLCSLTIRLPDGSTVTKHDAGGAANMKDAGDDDKSMVSDAFKRGAAKFGVGRYLYGDGRPGFVEDELEAMKARAKEERQRAKEPPAPTTPPEPREEAVDRSSVNRAFTPAGQAGDDTPARDPRSKEATDLWGDRIGAHGLDVRNWDTLRGELVAEFQARHNRHRVEQCGLLAADTDHERSVNEFRLLNYVLAAAVEAGAPDPNDNPVDPKTGKRKAIGNGKKSATVARLYLDREPEGWRNWIRRAIRVYLDLRLEEAKAAADAEAGYPPDDDCQLELVRGGAPAGNNGEAWAPGRE